MKFYARNGSAARVPDCSALQTGLNTLHFREKALGVTADRLLSLAAAPTFALMALLTGLLGSADMCLAAKASPLSGMALMYLLMSAFHLAPWLRLISARRSG